MTTFLDVVTKEATPRLDALYADFRSKKDPNFFQPFGTQIYVGRQGSGKTISAVKHVVELKEKYPECVVVSNLSLKQLSPKSYQEYSVAHRNSDSEGFDPRKHYITFKEADELANCLVGVNNGFYGVILLIDEIHTYFNSLESKNMPMYVFTEISQQRKQRKLIIGTSQLFMRAAKPLREQCDNIIVCDTFGGFFTRQRVYDGMSVEQDYEGKLTGSKKKTGWFFQTRKIRNYFDTYQKVVSGIDQFAEMQKPQEFKIKRNGKAIVVR